MPRPNIRQIPVDAAVAGVRFYQRFLRPVIPSHCRFYPTCSCYSIEAFRTHGLVRGGLLTGWRILRCQPFCRGGFDPVPPSKNT